MNVQEKQREISSNMRPNFGISRNKYGRNDLIARQA